MTNPIFTDGRFNAALRAIWDGVAANRIRRRNGEAWPNTGKTQLSRRELGALLSDLHRGRPARGVPLCQGQSSGPGTNAEFLGTAIDATSCTTALDTPQGYATKDKWNLWAGSHRGNWYNPDRCFIDNARWHSARDEPSRSGQGPARVYPFQPVDFFGNTDSAVDRRGWNQSHAEEQVVWGWDPKGGESDLTSGPHLGYCFEVGNTACIIWITPNEAFLECVRDVNLGPRPVGPGEDAPSPGSARIERRRTSVSTFTGAGQWVVTR